MRILAVLTTLLVLVGSSSLCSNGTYFTQQTAKRMCRVQQYMWGMCLPECRSKDSQQFGTLQATGVLPPLLSRSQGRYNFVLLHGLAMVLMISITAHVTRSSVTAKVLTDLCDRLSLVLRIALQLAICADLASGALISPTPAGHSPTTWANPAESAASQAACSCLYRFTIWHILAGTFLLNHLVLFSRDIHSELFAGLLEALPLCINLGLYQKCSSSAYYNSSSSNEDIWTDATLLTRMFRHRDISSVKAQTLAVTSRIILPILVQRVLLLPTSQPRGVQSNNMSRGNSSGGNSNSSRHQLTQSIVQFGSRAVTASSSTTTTTTTIASIPDFREVCYQTPDQR